MTPEQMAKLPRYAQDELNKLAADLRSFRRDLKSVLGGDEKSRVYVVRFIDGEDQPLPLHTRVGFRLPTQRRPDDCLGYLEFKMDADAQSVEVHGSQAIAVEPHSSNVCRIRLREW